MAIRCEGFALLTVHHLCHFPLNREEVLLGRGGKGGGGGGGFAYLSDKHQ